MAERTNALVLKTSVVKATEGSNPSPSALDLMGVAQRCGITTAVLIDAADVPTALVATTLNR